MDLKKWVFTILMVGLLSSSICDYNYHFWYITHTRFGPYKGAGMTMSWWVYGNLKLAIAFVIFTLLIRCYYPLPLFFLLLPVLGFPFLFGPWMFPIPQIALFIAPILWIYIRRRKRKALRND